MDWIHYEENDAPANVIESVDSAVLAGTKFLSYEHQIQRLKCTN
jgi:hypothetical protein